MSSTATVHLVRHGKVDNPKEIIYGRLPGYHLSESGEKEARAAARRLKGADVGALWSSPMERAHETAEIIGDVLGIPVTIDARLTESLTALEGVRGTLGALVTAPQHWLHFRNPLRPSWGESFEQIRGRMLEAVREALDEANGRDAVIVSHKTPLQVCRLALAGRSLPLLHLFIPCHTGSVTSLALEDGRRVSASYFNPSG